MGQETSYHSETKSFTNNDVDSAYGSAYGSAYSSTSWDADSTCTTCGDVTPNLLTTTDESDADLSYDADDEIEPTVMKNDGVGCSRNSVESSNNSNISDNQTKYMHHNQTVVHPECSRKRLKSSTTRPYFHEDVGYDHSSVLQLLTERSKLTARIHKNRRNDNQLRMFVTDYDVIGLTMNH